MAYRRCVCATPYGAALALAGWLTDSWELFDGDLASSGVEWRTWPLWRLLNAFYFWFAGPDRAQEHREQVTDLLEQMTRAYDSATGSRDVEAPVWWQDEEEAYESTRLLMSRLR